MPNKDFIKNITSQKNSIFVKILMPTIAVMLLQVALISLVLVLNGTVASLEDSATESLYRNAENRSITLQNMMVHTWSNIDNLQTNIANVASDYMAENGLSREEVFGVPAREKELLARIPDTLIYTMRTTSTTGVFVFFVDQQAAGADTASLTGLYYRDFNPMMNPSDYSDIQLEKGPAAIAQKMDISLSSLWSELYTVKSAHTSTWEALLAPYLAAMQNPGLEPGNLALWSDAHYLDPDSINDSIACITYTRPLFFEGKLVGVIGVEVQVEYLKNFFPASDIGEMGGYALLHYRLRDDERQDLSCAVNAVTGSYIKRLADFGTTLVLTPKSSGQIYQAVSENFEPSSVAVQEIKLYNSHAPFSDRQWALAALQPNSVLFANSANIKSGLLSSSVVSLLLGFIFILITIRMATKPLLSIALQIEHGNADDLVVVKNSNTYEVNLLCDTINEMKRKRKDVEIALREEGERYLLALESAIDIFIEYDIENDRLRLYFFTEEGQKQQLTAQVIEKFRADEGIARICHPSDAGDFMAILCGERSEPCEMRMQAALFPHIVDMPSDEGYYWFSFSAVQIHADDQTLDKTIGSAKQITREKLMEFARIEASRRDLTTNAYKREYGRLILAGKSDGVAKRDQSDCLLAIVIDNFEQIEAYYGRIFGAAVLMEISNRILALSPVVHSLIRWSNAEFVAFCAESEVAGFAEKLWQIYDSIYTGENREIALAINLGICRSGGSITEESVACAIAAAYSCASTGVNFQFAGEQVERAAAERSLSQSGPYSDVGIEISNESIVGFALNLFEQTNDVKSVINMLLRILGGLLGLDRIIICEYDEDFGANQIAYQWVSAGTRKHQGDRERIRHADFVDFTSRLNERGMLFYDSVSARGFSDGMQQLLCIRDDTEFVALCCEMYESGLHAGRAIFASFDQGYKLPESDMLSVYEVVKIISTRLNLEKSNSASRAKSEFLSKISHEIRTPMNAIIGLTRIAADGVENPEQVKNSLEKIDLSAKHLLSLINDVLDMSRIERGNLTIENRPFSLSTVVSSIDTLMRPQFEDKGIHFTILPTIANDRVEGDEQKLCQVLINLLGNACKFTPTGGRVDFIVSQQLEREGICQCLFSVKDNGVGIPKEDQLNIFGAFEQSATSNMEAGNPRGTGLGLAISTSFIAAMGSKIELKSERGVGSEFYFTLTLALGENLPQMVAAEKTEGAFIGERLKGKRALVVDDNDINLEIATYLIGDIGVICEVAKDGKEAVEKFLASAPGYYSIIFMDISMPVMDGFAATREIRKRVERADSRTIPIIAMTANAFSEDTKKSIEAGMNAHVAKPIDVGFLYTTLETIFPPKGTDDDNKGE